MKLSRAFALVGAIIGAQLAAPSLRGEETNTVEIIRQLQQRIEELEQKVKTLEAGRASGVTTNEDKTNQRIEALDQKVRILERNRELEEEAAEAKPKEMPKIMLGDQGFSFSSPDGDFGVRLRGVLQVDSRTFLDESQIVGNDTLLLRRARPILEGTVFRDFDFLFVPDFGGTSGPQIFDAYLNYRFNPALQFQAGKFKTPVGLEQLQADRDILFNERSLATDLVPNRDLGLELHGDLLDGVVSYAAGVFNGVGDARNSNNADFENDRSFAGRLFFQPFRKTFTPLQGFGFGVAGSYEDMQTTNTTGLPSTTGGTLPGYFTVGQQQFFAYNTNVAAAGQHWRISPQGYYFIGPFSLLGEYVVSDQRVGRTGAGVQPSAHLANTAWQIQGSWVLTGEDATFYSVAPRRPFNPLKGGWGALQLVARYSELDIDPAAFPQFADPAASAHAAHEWSVGLDWYLNRNVRFDASFSHTTFAGGGGRGTKVPAIVTQQDENVVFTRVQLAF